MITDVQYLKGNVYYKYINGSFSYDNRDRSTYQNFGDGHAVYNNPRGQTFHLEVSTTQCFNGVSTYTQVALSLNRFAHFNRSTITEKIPWHTRSSSCHVYLTILIRVSSAGFIYFVLLIRGSTCTIFLHSHNRRIMSFSMCSFVSELQNLERWSAASICLGAISLTLRCKHRSFAFSTCLLYVWNMYSAFSDIISAPSPSGLVIL